MGERGRERERKKNRDIERENNEEYRERWNVDGKKRDRII